MASNKCFTITETNLSSAMFVVAVEVRKRRCGRSVGRHEVVAELLVRLTLLEFHRCWSFIIIAAADAAVVDLSQN